MALVFDVGRCFLMSATLENMVLAFGIAFLSIIRENLFLLPVSGRHIEFHIDGVSIRCRSMFPYVCDPENMVIAFGIAFLSIIQPEL